MRRARYTPDRTVQGEIDILVRLGFTYGGTSAGGHHLLEHPQYGPLRPMSSTPRRPFTWRRDHRREVARVMGLNLFQFERLIAGQSVHSKPGKRKRRPSAARRRKALHLVPAVESRGSRSVGVVRAWRLRCVDCAYPVNHEGLRPGVCPRCGHSVLREAAMMTPEEARAAWVEALRSGEYEQGRQVLAAKGKHCCLGVACELAIKDGVPVARDGSADDRWVEYDGHEASLPESVRKWLGLHTEDGAYTARNHRHTNLAARNDARVPFSKIADLIESAPKGLFA